MAEKFQIREADENDIKNVFDLSNDEAVRKNSINKNKIEWKNHVIWFNNRLKRADEPFYIIESLNGNFIGQVRIEKRNGENEISVSIAEAYRGKGLSSKIIKESIKKSGIKNITAYISDYNKASIHTFEKAGFENTHLLKYILINKQI